MSSSTSPTHKDPDQLEPTITSKSSATTASHATQSESVVASTEVESNIPELSQDLTNFYHYLLPLVSDKDISSEMKTPIDVVDYINKLPDFPGDPTRVSLIFIFLIVIFCDKLFNDLFSFSVESIEKNERIHQ